MHQIVAFLLLLTSKHLTLFSSSFLITLCSFSSGSAITTYSVDPIKGHFNRSQTLTFTMPKPGPVSDRQDVPHIHEVLVDPTGRFLLAPDLGSDLVRVFHINPTTGRLTEQRPLVTPPGSGPRHGVFWYPETAAANTSENSRFYLVSELDNYLRGYDVTYSPNGTMLFSQFYECNTYGGVTPPTAAKAAEIAISVCSYLIPSKKSGLLTLSLLSAQ